MAPVSPLSLTFSLQAIYHVQKNLEDTQLTHFPGRILLCDRGTLDGAAYWDKGLESWCEHVNTTVETELDRYDAVIFFQSAAMANHAINGSMLEGGNAARTENSDQARDLDGRLEEIWSRHPKFYMVKSQDSFFAKVQEAVELFRKIVAVLHDEADVKISLTE